MVHLYRVLIEKKHELQLNSHTLITLSLTRGDNLAVIANRYCINCYHNRGDIDTIAG